MHDRTQSGFATLAIHAGQGPDAATGATIVPIYATTTYTQTAPGQHKGYEYSRGGNPTRAALEACLAALEGGAVAAAFASGQAATAAVLAAHLRPGAEVVTTAELYGGTYRALEELRPWGVATRYVDGASADGLVAALSPATRLVWLETPTNPLLTVIDIAAVARRTREAGTLLVVDNTFATPYLQRPMTLGADLVVHSTTKYIGGHSDVMGGAVVGPADLVAPVRRQQSVAGGVPGPFDAWLTLRGVKTLALRMEQHSANAVREAEWLARHPRADAVYYPGLAGHPGREAACRQMRAFGGVVTVRLRGGRDAAFRFLSRLRVFSLAESLGGVESLAGHPVSMSHAGVPAEARSRAGVDEALVRLSVGVEDVEDLLRDLAAALG